MYRINYDLTCERITQLPVVDLDDPYFNEGQNYLVIDTGSQLNLIKERSIATGVDVNTKKIYSLTGIGSGTIRTYGELTTVLRGIEIKFQIVGDSFPIEQAGILSKAFLTKQEAIIAFRDKMPSKLILGCEEISFCNHPSFDLPPRTKKLVSIPVKNVNQRKGYVRKISLGPGIYLGEVLATQENGFIKVFAINCTTNYVNLTVPPIELEEFEIHPPLARTVRLGDPGKDNEKSAAERLSKLSTILELDELNRVEKASILKTVVDFPFQFCLPGDRLGSTDVLKHRIITTDDIPINTKPYRYPQIQKDEIQKQVNSLLETGVIGPSESP